MFSSDFTHCVVPDFRLSDRCSFCALVQKVNAPSSIVHENVLLGSEDAKVKVQFFSPLMCKFTLQWRCEFTISFRCLRLCEIAGDDCPNGLHFYHLVDFAGR